MTTETLMTEAATTTEGAAAPESATQVSATAADDGGQKQQATEGQGTGSQQAEGATTEGEKSSEKKQEGAPESYEFKAPEGVTFDDAVIGAFSEVAKELNLPQEHAQKVLDKMAPVIAQRQSEQLTAANAQWVESVKTDKEFGGDALNENLAVAKKAFDEFTSPELRTLLNQTGLGNHPEIIRVFYRAGKALSEDRFVAGKGGKPDRAEPRNLYAASNMNP